MDKVSLNPFVLRVYLAVALTTIFVAMYIVVQQDYRTGLNDPQIQLAEDGALKLSLGAAPAVLVPREASASIDIQKSLSPWLVVYDQAGLVLESSAVLNNAPPKLPQGIFNTSTWSKAPMYTQNGMQESRVTWQPEAGVRQALVLVHVSNGMYVALGRNMREVEQRIEHLGEMLFAAWLVTLVALLLTSFPGLWYLKFGRY